METCLQIWVGVSSFVDAINRKSIRSSLRVDFDRNLAFGLLHHRPVFSWLHIPHTLSVLVNPTTKTIDLAILVGLYQLSIVIKELLAEPNPQTTIVLIDFEDQSALFSKWLAPKVNLVLFVDRLDLVPFNFEAPGWLGLLLEYL